MNTSSLPQVQIPNFDKFVHAVMFAALSGSIFFENSNYFKKPVFIRKIFMGSFLFPVFMGGLVELGQKYFTTTRAGDWMDFLSDGIGAFIIFLICLIINKRLLYFKTSV